MQWDETLQRDVVDLRLAGICLVVLAVGLFIVGTVLVVTCAPTTLALGHVGCTYPFQSDGGVFLYVAALVAILAFNLFWPSLSHRGSPQVIADRRKLISGLGIVVSTVFFVIAMGLSGLL
jgi:uncharacterized BrkB/YihY/UPF0761 family membrane protein